MKCGDLECRENAMVICNVHKTRFCGFHYTDHCFTCTNTPIRIDIAKEMRLEQLRNLTQKIDRAKKQIVEVANELVFSINSSVKNSLNLLDQQGTVVRGLIQMSKPENQVKEFLKIVPAGITKVQKSFQGLLDIEQKYNMRDFMNQIQVLEKKFAPVDPVFESVEKLDKKGRIQWCKDQNLLLLPDAFLDEIKIAKDSQNVFICIYQIVCKIQIGKGKLGKNK